MKDNSFYITFIDSAYYTIYRHSDPMKVFFIVVLAVVLNSCYRNSNNNSGQETNSADNSVTTNTATDSTLVAINQRIASDPGNFKNYLDRAKYYSTLEMYDNAFQDIARALAADSTKAEIFLVKGDVYWKRKQIKEAYNEYSRCVELDGTNTDCLLNKSGIDIALRNYDKAREHINAALQQNEFLPYAYYLRGRMYKELKDTNMSASSYKTAIEVDPNYYDAYIEVGLLYAEQKNDLAKEYYNSAIAIKPRSVEAWYNKAMFLQETGFKDKKRYNEAFACYDSILNIDKNFVASHFNKGYIFLEYMQRYDSASFYFTKALQQYPQYYQAYYNRGLSYESMNKRKEAEADYRMALSIQPDYTDAAISLNRILNGR